MDGLTGAGPGELFLVRNVGAFVAPRDQSRGFHGTAAAIEFAVLNLQVRRIIERAGRGQGVDPAWLALRHRGRRGACLRCRCRCLRAASRADNAGTGPYRFDACGVPLS